jgi:tRNA pseudouridine55 synthase
LNQDKIYRFTARFGTETDTLDKTGKVVATRDVPGTSETELRNALTPFLGGYVQKVPRFAAVRVGGRRLYELSRKGVEVDRPEREVHIRSLELCGMEWPEATFEMHCSKGTYVRQLASDIGDRLGCGAHVRELRRIAAGSFHIDQAVRLEEIREKAAFDRQSLLDRILPMTDALAHLAALRIENEQAMARLRNGQLEPDLENELRDRFGGQDEAVRLIVGDNRLAALWWPKAVEDGSRRLRVFAF